MSDKQLRELLGELSSEGRRESGGVFTLDWRKAREKLQKFRLVDPHRWVVHAVMGALAGGATAVHVQTDADDCVVRFDGPPMPPEQMQDLFSYLLADLDDERARELALAYYTAAALRPSRLQLDSGGYRLRVNGAEVEVVPSDREATLNELAVRERVSWKVVRQMVTRQTPEAEILTRACRQAPVWLNGTCLAEPWEPSAVVTVGAGSIQMESTGLHLTAEPPEGCRGAAVALWADGPPEGVVKFLRYGVQVSEKQLDLGGHRVMALLDAPALRLNVSQSDVLEDARYEELIEYLRGLVKQALIGLARRPELAPNQIDLLREMCALKLTLPGKLEEPYLRALAEAPIWENHAGELVGLPLTGLCVTRSRWKHPCLLGRTVLQHHPLLDRIYPTSWDGDPMLREAQNAYDRRRAWEEAVPGPVELHGYYLRVHDFTLGQIGFLEESSRPTVLMCFKDRRPLGAVGNVEELPPGLEIAVNRDDFKLDLSWTHPERDAAWKAMLASLPLEAAYAGLDSRAHVMNFLQWRLARGDKSKLDPALEAVALFERLDGTRASLAQMRELAQIPYLEEPPPQDLRQEVATAFLLTSDQWAVLTHFLGEDRLVDQQSKLDPLLREREFMARPEVELWDLLPGIARVDIEGGRLVLEKRAPARKFVVEALYRGRLLERLELEPAPFGSVLGRMEIEGRARPSPSYDRVGRGRAELLNWLTGRLPLLALRYATDFPDAPTLLEYFCAQLPPDWATSQDELVRAICALPLLVGGLTLDGLHVLITRRQPPELRQSEKLILTGLVGRSALEMPRAEELVEPGRLPEMPEGYELTLTLPEPWKGMLGLTRRKSSKIRVFGRKSATKRCPVGFQASLVEAPAGTDWHRRFLELVSDIAREHASEHPDYLFYLMERGLERLDDIPVRGDVLGRPFTLSDLLAGPVAYLEPGQRAPAAPPDGPLYRLSEAQLKAWGEVFRLEKFVPPLTALEDLYPEREWLVRVKLDPPLEGELGVPLEGEAGEIRILGRGGWTSRPMPNHRGLLGVVRGDVPDLFELLPLERVEFELAALDRQDPPFRERVRGWRDWRTVGLGLAGSPLAPPPPPPPQEGTPAPHEVREPPMSDYQRLSVALKEQMARILGGDPELRKALPAEITFGPTPKGAFCHCTPDGRVILDEKHPLIARLLKAESPEDEYFYFLVSAVFSVINRARADIKDEHEREFHARLLAHLLKEDA